jgi:hypothetical protein
MSSARSGPQTPWWLEPGSERCDVCLGAYHYELRVHCEACDEPLCPGCAVEVLVERVTVWRCPACSRAPDEGDG